MQATWAWTVVALAGLLVYLRLRQRSLIRADDPDVQSYPRTHPVQRLSRLHVRTNTLWIWTFLLCIAVGLLIIARELFVLPYEVPTGFGIVAILVLLITPVVIGMWNEWDEERMSGDKSITISNAVITGTNAEGVEYSVSDATVTGIATTTITQEAE
jgi:hypothetical protein